jgi:hypothetical protein
MDGVPSRGEATMNGKVAAVALCGVCLVLVLLLLTGRVTRAGAGVAFAASLLLLGIASRGFRGPGRSRP